MSGQYPKRDCSEPTNVSLCSAAYSNASANRQPDVLVQKSILCSGDRKDSETEDERVEALNPHDLALLTVRSRPNHTHDLKSDTGTTDENGRGKRAIVMCLVNK